MRFFFLPRAFFLLLLFSAHFRLIYCEEPREKLGGPRQELLSGKNVLPFLYVSLIQTGQTKRDTLFNRKKPPRQHARYLFLSEIRNKQDNNAKPVETKKKTKPIINNYISGQFSLPIYDKQHPGINFDPLPSLPWISHVNISRF